MYREAAASEHYASGTSSSVAGHISTPPPAYPGALLSVPQQPPARPSQQQNPVLQDMLRQYQALVLHQQPKQDQLLSEHVRSSQTDLYAGLGPNEMERTARAKIYSAMTPSDDRLATSQSRLAPSDVVESSLGARDAGVQRDSSPQDVGAHVSSRMLGVLSEDNKKLRQELEAYIKKTAKLQQVYRLLFIFL